jgi:oligopeptide transport system ATP-binding protein
LFDHPLHPYTLALMEALPRADRRREHTLKSIRGAPPNLLVEPRGCPFAPRCDYVQEHCVQENPALLELVPGHRAACWVDVQTGALRA